MVNAIMQQTRVAPWIGIGVSGEWKSSAEALEAAQLDFDVRQERLYWQREEPNNIVYYEDAPMFANIRNTDDTLLGCVTPQYQIIQNRDAFSLIDPFITNGVITNAGMTESGLCFMVARVQVERSICNEPYEIDLMLTNSFNTKYPCQIIMTPIRIYCQNMYRKLINDRIFIAKHTIAVGERLNQLAQGNIIEKKIGAFSNVIESSQCKSMSKDQFNTLLSMLFPYPKEGGPREETFKLKVDAARDEFVDKYFDAPDNREHQDTAFGFINSYYDYLSHRPAPRETGMAWADRRLSGLISGADIAIPLLKQAMK